jgi:hypothetical protein
MRAGDALRFDLGVVENGGSHSCNASIADRTSVDHSSVCKGAIFTDEGRGYAAVCLYEGVFLEIRSPRYLDSLDVASKLSVKKDRDVVADSGVFYDPHVRRQKRKRC